MTDAGNLSIRPGSPADFGVARPELPVEKVEPSRLLANEARDDLRAAGLDDTQIDDWADAYFAHHDEGDGADLVAWIQGRQGAS